METETTDQRPMVAAIARLVGDWREEDEAERGGVSERGGREGSVGICRQFEGRGGGAGLVEDGNDCWVLAAGCWLLAAGLMRAEKIPAVMESGASQNDPCNRKCRCRAGRDWRPRKSHPITHLPRLLVSFLMYTFHHGNMVRGLALMGNGLCLFIKVRFRGFMSFTMLSNVFLTPHLSPVNASHVRTASRRPVTCLSPILPPLFYSRLQNRLRLPFA
jgi:hypothetical protein